jgi:ubiquinone/menaquinone biosynthesis C-methylase UbiE
LTLKRYCDHLVCTEKDQNSPAADLGLKILERNESNIDYRLCDAEDLSEFADSSFDLVFTSNMLEHVHDIDKCLQECRRVVKDDGVMLHTMPSRYWKTAYFTCSLLKFQAPKIHGINNGHFSEWLAFGRESWKKRFEANGLVVERIVGMPFYVGHGNSFIPLIKAGNAANLPSSYLYIVSKG